MDVAKLIERLRGSDPDRVTPVDALRLHDQDPATFPLSPEDVEGVLDLIEEVATALETLQRERDEAVAELEDAKANAEHHKQVAERMNRVATDRRYMMTAYRNMLGPVALKVIEGWEARNTLRVHLSWGPDAYTLTGEERAQKILDMEVAAASTSPVESVDSAALTQGRLRNEADPV